MPLILGPYFLFYSESVTISKIPTNVNFANALTTTITLQTPQPDISFKPAVGYMTLSIPVVEGTVQINLWVDSYTATTIDIAIKAPASGAPMQILKIVYLIVPSVYINDIYVFNPDGCIMASCGFDYVLNPATTLSLVQPYPVVLATGNYQAIGFTNALNIKSTNFPSATVGISFKVSIVNATHYSLNFKGIATDPVLLQGYYVTLIVYRSPSYLYGLKISTLTLQIPNTINDDSISIAKTFYGLGQYSFQNADFQFRIDVGNKTARKLVFPNMISLRVPLITFEVGICCLGTPFMDETNSSCVASCSNRYYPATYTDNISKSCQPCSYDCFTCDNQTSCITCNITTDFRQLNPTTLRCDPIAGYYDVGITIAQPCNYPKCCGYTPVTYNEGSSCVVICPSGFVENATKVCVPCGTGFLAVSGHCTDVVGCVATTVQNGSVLCIFCKLSQHFILQNQTCICSQGYSLDTKTGKCLEVCGDGINFSHKCDDNNTEDGDGCSSSCQSEDYFLCDSTSNYIPSECAYVSSVQLTINSVKKTQGKNQGVFIIGFSAKHAKLSAAKIVSSFSFTCDPRITIVSMSASSTEVLLSVDYDEDLEGNIASVIFSLNTKKILLPSAMTMFLMVSSNQKLIVVRSYSMIATLRKTIEALALTALVVFGIASFTYRMIAIQLVHSFLLVYLICIDTSYPTEPYLTFKNLRLLSLNFKDEGNYYSQNSALAYSSENQLNTKKTLSILLIATFSALVIEKIIRECLKDIEGKLAAKTSKILMLVKYTLISTLFCNSIGYGYQVIMPSFMSPSSNNNLQTYQYQIPASLILFLSVCFSLQLFGQFGRAAKKQKNAENQGISLHRRCYPSFYLFFWMDIMILLVLSSIHKSDCIEESSLAIILLLFFWFICSCPYCKAIHNAGQIVNLSIDVAFLSWSVGRKYNASLREQEMQVYLCFVVIFLMSLSLILSIIRIVGVIVSGCWSDKKLGQPIAQQKEEIKVECERIEDALQIQNKYRIKSILLSEQLLEISSSVHPSHNSKWKKELMSTIRQKYKINSSQEGEQSEASEDQAQRAYKEP